MNNSMLYRFRRLPGAESRPSLSTWSIAVTTLTCITAHSDDGMHSIMWRVLKNISLGLYLVSDWSWSDLLTLTMYPLWLLGDPPEPHNARLSCSFEFVPANSRQEPCLMTSYFLQHWPTKEHQQRSRKVTVIQVTFLRFKLFCVIDPIAIVMLPCCIDTVQFITYGVRCYDSVVYATCTTKCPSQVGVLSKRLNIIMQHPPKDSRTILVF